MREKIVKLAITELGAIEPIGDDKYIQWYNKEILKTWCFSLNGTAWCAIFVSYIYHIAGLTQNEFKADANCASMIKSLERKGQYKTARTGYKAQPGDLIFFDWNVNNSPDHVGIVETVDTTTIYTIEGNTSSQVARRKYSLQDRRIMGYGVVFTEQQWIEILRAKTDSPDKWIDFVKANNNHPFGRFLPDLIIKLNK